MGLPLDCDQEQHITAHRLPACHDGAGGTVRAQGYDLVREASPRDGHPSLKMRGRVPEVAAG